MSDWSVLEAELSGTGWRVVRADASEDPTKAGTLEALGRALDLPRWWGRNLDALADCLADPEPSRWERTLLLWDGWSQLAAADPRTFGLVRRLLVDAGLSVLLRGADPHLDGQPPGP